MAAGSTTLTPENTDWYERHLGERYVVVEQQPKRPFRMPSRCDAEAFARWMVAQRPYVSMRPL